MRKAILCVGLLAGAAIAGVASLWGQEKKPVRPPAILDLIGYAQAAPPEFAADALIRIAESDKITDNAWKRELLEQALLIAPGAQYKTKRPNAAGGGGANAGFLSYAFEMEMDTLSLQLRALKTLYKTDPKRARELFLQIPPLRLQPLTCNDALTYDVSPFYEALGEMFRDQKVDFLEPYVQQINSHTQVDPVIELILTRKSAPRDLEKLAAELSAALPQIEHDPRSFSRFRNMKEVNDLATALQAAGISPQGFLTAYQNYIEAHLSARQCRSEYWTNPVYTKNRRFRSPDETPFTSPINDAMFKPDRTFEFEEGQPPNDPASPDADKLVKQVLALGNNTDGKPATDADKKGIAWQTALSEFRNALEEWKQEAEKTPENYFYAKCLLLAMLLEKVPRSDTELRANVVQSYTAFLVASPMRVTSRIEWWRQARGLLENTPEATAAFARSQDPVMWLYVNLNKTLGPLKPQ